MKEYGDTLPLGEWDIDGWRIKTTQGRKHPDDRQIWVAAPTGDYHLLSLAALGWIARAWWLNEETLYPVAHGLRGGEIVLDYLRDACHLGPYEAARLHKLKPPTIYPIVPDDIQKRQSPRREDEG